MQTILVCDDDKQIVEAINIYLTGEGFEVTLRLWIRGGEKDVQSAAGGR